MSEEPTKIKLIMEFECQSINSAHSFAEECDREFSKQTEPNIPKMINWIITKNDTLISETEIKDITNPIAD